MQEQVKLQFSATCRLPCLILKIDIPLFYPAVYHAMIIQEVFGNFENTIDLERAWEKILLPLGDV